MLMQNEVKCFISKTLLTNIFVTVEQYTELLKLIGIKF
jgi:hypothetical protein